MNLNERSNRLLVVVDMQNDFITGALKNPAAEAIVSNVCKKIEEWDGVIVATQDTHYSNYDETLESKAVPVHCLLESYGWQLDNSVRASIKKKAFSQTFLKNTYGSLDLMNSAGWYDSIELIGVCTDICVLSNAVLLRATNPNTPISVDSSCCAGTTVENHNNALNSLKMIGIEIK